MEIDLQHIRNATRGADDEPCLKVLGNTVSRKNLAVLWTEQAQDLQIIMSHLLIERALKGENFHDYREGLIDVISFFENCFQEEMRNRVDASN